MDNKNLVDRKDAEQTSCASDQENIKIMFHCEQFSWPPIDVGPRPSTLNISKAELKKCIRASSIPIETSPATLSYIDWGKLKKNLDAINGPDLFKLIWNSCFIEICVNGESSSKGDLLDCSDEVLHEAAEKASSRMFELIAVVEKFVRGARRVEWPKTL